MDNGQLLLDDYNEDSLLNEFFKPADGGTITEGNSSWTSQNSSDQASQVNVGLTQPQQILITPQQTQLTFGQTFQQNIKSNFVQNTSLGHMTSQPAQSQIHGNGTNSDGRIYINHLPHLRASGCSSPVLVKAGSPNAVNQQQSSLDINSCILPNANPQSGILIGQQFIQQVPQKGPFQIIQAKTNTQNVLLNEESQNKSGYNPNVGQILPQAASVNIVPVAGSASGATNLGQHIILPTTRSTSQIIIPSVQLNGQLSFSMPQVQQFAVRPSGGQGANIFPGGGIISNQPNTIQLTAGTPQVNIVNLQGGGTGQGQPQIVIQTPPPVVAPSSQSNIILQSMPHGFVQIQSQPIIQQTHSSVSQLNATAGQGLDGGTQILTSQGSIPLQQFINANPGQPIKVVNQTNLITMNPPGNQPHQLTSIDLANMASRSLNKKRPVKKRPNTKIEPLSIKEESMSSSAAYVAQVISQESAMTNGHSTVSYSNRYHPVRPDIGSRRVASNYFTIPTTTISLSTQSGTLTDVSSATGPVTSVCGPLSGSNVLQDVLRQSGLGSLAIEDPVAISSNTLALSSTHIKTEGPDSESPFTRELETITTEVKQLLSFSSLSSSDRSRLQQLMTRKEILLQQSKTRISQENIRQTNIVQVPIVGSQKDLPNQISHGSSISSHQTTTHTDLKPAICQTSTTPYKLNTSTPSQTNNFSEDKLVHNVLSQQQKDVLQSRLAELPPERQQMFYQRQAQLMRQWKENEKQQQINAQLAQKALTPMTDGHKPTSVIQVTEASVTSSSFTTSSVSTSSASSTDHNAQQTKSVSTKRTVIHQQLRCDQCHAQKADHMSPFKNCRHAIQRLLRFHVYQGHEPTPAKLMKFDDQFEAMSLQALKKSKAMINKYHHLLLVDSMRPACTAEIIQLQRLAISDIHSLIKKEKIMATEDPERFVATLKRDHVASSPHSVCTEQSDHKESNLSDSTSDVFPMDIKKEVQDDGYPDSRLTPERQCNTTSIKREPQSDDLPNKVPFERYTSPSAIDGSASGHNSYLSLTEKRSRDVYGSPISGSGMSDDAAYRTSETDRALEGLLNNDDLSVANYQYNPDDFKPLNGSQVDLDSIQDLELTDPFDEMGYDDTPYTSGANEDICKSEYLSVTHNSNLNFSHSTGVADSQIDNHEYIFENYNSNNGSPFLQEHLNIYNRSSQESRILHDTTYRSSPSPIVNYSESSHVNIPANTSFTTSSFHRAPTNSLNYSHDGILQISDDGGQNLLNGDAGQSEPFFLDEQICNAVNSIIDAPITKSNSIAIRISPFASNSLTLPAVNSSYVIDDLDAAVQSIL